MATRTYDPAQVTIVVGGKIVSGFAAGTFVTIERDADMWTKIVGVDGTSTRAKSNNYGGVVTITLQHTSPSNAYLQSLATADELTNAGVVPVIVRDAGGSILATALTAWVKKLPSAEYGAEAGERQWVIDSDRIDMALAGAGT